MGKINKTGDEQVNPSQNNQTDINPAKSATPISPELNAELNSADPQAIRQINAPGIGADVPSKPNLKNVPLQNLRQLMETKNAISGSSDGHYVHTISALANELTEFCFEIMESAE